MSNYTRLKECVLMFGNNIPVLEHIVKYCEKKEDEEEIERIKRRYRIEQEALRQLEQERNR